MTAGLILAAGRGSRFGARKMLAEIDGRPMLQRVLDLAADAALEPIVVVLGEDAYDIVAAISWRNEIRVRNPDPGRGISSSVVLGLDAIQGADIALVVLGDQPFLTVTQLNAVISAPTDQTRPIVVPRYADGRPGNPVRLEQAAWPLATSLEGDRGMSQLFRDRPELVRYVDVGGENPDIDRPADRAQFGG